MPLSNVEQIDVVGNRGICGGVKMAFEGLDQVIDITRQHSKSPRKVYLTWDLVNNKPVMDEYRQKGIVTFEDLTAEATKKGLPVDDPWLLIPERSIVGISAHGDQPVFFERARERQSYALNLACQLVKKVNRLSEEANKLGALVLYAGKVYPNGIIHPETASNLARLDHANQLLLDETQLKDLPHSELVDYLTQLGLPPERHKIALSQTTLSPRYLDKLYGAIAEAYPETVFRDRKGGDLCPAMRNRSAGAYAAIPQVDLWLVVGSKTSHNSQELKESGSEVNVPSYSVDYPNEVDLNWFEPKIKRVGITSGASVPDRIMDLVINRLVTLNPAITLNRLPQVVTETNKMFQLPTKDIKGLESWLQAQPY